MPNYYYDRPVQVKWWDSCDGKWTGGIAYQDMIICGCCGSFFEIKDIFENAPDTIAVPVIELDWIDINEEIIGDMK